MASALGIMIGMPLGAWIACLLLRGRIERKIDEFVRQGFDAVEGEQK